MADVQVRRDHKSRLFPKIFEDKQSLLELYNAVNGSDYGNPEDLIVSTIDDILYMGMKNDLSFLVENRMNLYEHQSTWNPNMPLRGLFYFSRLYQGYVAEMNLDIYSQVRLKLPAPEYVVFYNGGAEMPDRLVLKLSDSFPAREDGVHALECRAIVFNINFGHNQELMKSCRKLYEYSYLIARIREFLSDGLTLTAAVDKAVETCIRENVLADFLKKHRAEVKEMILTEYNEELHIRSEKALSYQEGLEDGRRQGQKVGEELGRKLGEKLGQESGEKRGAERINALVSRLLKEKRFADLERATADAEFQKKLLNEYGIE